MRGKEKISTSFGACVSIIVILLTLSFGLLKLQHLIERKNPSISTNTLPIPEGTRFNTGDRGDFLLAFGVIRQLDTERSMYDPRYIRWQASLRSRNGSFKDTTKDHLDIHQCTSEEIARFHEPADEQTAIEVEHLLK